MLCVSCLRDAIWRRVAEKNSLCVNGRLSNSESFHDCILLWPRSSRPFSQPSSGCESVPLKSKGGMPPNAVTAGISLWLSTHIHHLPGILLCMQYDWLQILLQLVELSPLPGGMIECRP